jgi:hypothetical protein
MFPYSHCWGSQIYAEHLRGDEGGPIELDGKYHAPDDNPGYKAECHVGDKLWWQTGNIPAAALVNPAPLPPCCFEAVSHQLHGKAELCVHSYSYAVNYGWVRMRPAVAISAGGELAYVQRIAGSAPLELTSAGYLLDGGRIVGRGAVALTAGGSFVYAPRLRGHASIALTPAAARIRRYELHGKAELGPLVGRAELGPWHDAGLVGVALQSDGSLILAQQLAGRAPALLRSAAELVYGPHLAADAPLVLESAGTMDMGLYLAGAAAAVLGSAGILVYGQYVAGRAGVAIGAAGLMAVGFGVGHGAGLALVAAGGMIFSLSLVGSAAMQLTANATLTFQPASGPGATCAAAGVMALGTTYGPFPFPATGATDWWVFTAVGGHGYSLTFPVTGPGGMSGVVAQGSCPSPTNQGGFGPPGATITPTFSGNAFLKLQKVGGSGTYTIKVV